MVRGPMLLAAALAGVYLLWDPPSADLAAQTFRADLFADEGFAVWNNAWYAGHHVPGYSLLFPPLAALLTPQLAGALSAVASAGLFAALAGREYGSRARLGSYWFAAASVAVLLSGRLTFALGVALGLAAMLAVQRARPGWAALLGALTPAASPVAGAFLVIVSGALFLARRPRVGGRALGSGPAATRPASRRPRDWGPAAAAAVGAGLALGVIVLAFPVVGTAPFVASAFWAVPAFCVLALFLLPADASALRWGVAMYGLATVVLFSFDNAMGGNAVRLGALFAGPVMALALAGRRPLALAVVALPLLYWQLQPAVRDVADAADDPSVEAAFHAPLAEELDSLTVGAPVRVHVPPTRNRWEAVHLAADYPLARGWLRQAESDDFDLFDDGVLTPAAHERWLRERAVSYVAVPRGVELDYLAKDEAALIAADPPYLELAWESPDWALYDVTPPVSFVADPAAPLEGVDAARIAAIHPDGFELTADEPGTYLVRVRYTRYWEVTAGDACVRDRDGWTAVRVTAPSLVRVEARLGLDALVGARRQC